MFGPGPEYSAKVLRDSEARERGFSDAEKDFQRVANLFLTLQQWAFFVDRGFYPLLMPDKNPTLKRGCRYLLSAGCDDPRDPSMSHVILVDELGNVFDPDPKFDPKNRQYSIETYTDLIGWEIIRWSR